jgi:flagellar hook protein FlgE
MSFQQGLSGLNASSKNLEIIGNNIANANTYGAKTSRAEFADVYAAALNGAGTSAVGIGTNIAAVAQQFTQGSITTTSNQMDLAINGGGFFQLTDGASPPVYSRNGQFKVDANGYIVNNAQLQLMGYAADASGNIQTGVPVPMHLPTAPVDPLATSTMSVELNLDSRLKVPTPPASGDPIDYADPKTYNSATSVTVYDVNGKDVALTYYFQKASTSAAGDTWNVYATANGLDINSASSTPTLLKAVTFSPAGTSPVDDTGAAVNALAVSIQGPLTNAAGATIVTPMDITLDLSKATAFAAAFSVSDMAQNGYTAGQLTGLAIASNGTVTANYSNGQQQVAGQVVLANFRNPQGLQPIGNNAWGSTVASGPALPPGVPGDGNLGALQAGALEESNVDLTGELVNMITAQRFYQANAQTIKTQDQVLQTLVNLR